VANLPWLFWALPSLLLSIARFGKIVPLFFGDSNPSAKPLPSEHETCGSAFGYLDTQQVLANRFGADKLSRDSNAWDEDWFPNGDGMLGAGHGASQKTV
jgi:hypothetical protein